MEVMAVSLNGGLVSVRRMANLLDLAVDDLAQVFAAQGIEQAVAL